MKIIKLLFLTFCISQTLFADDEKIKQLANTIATPFYNVYNSNVIEILEQYLKKNKDIEAISIYDTMIDNTAIIYYKKDGKEIFEVDKDFPKQFVLPKIQSSVDIVKNGKTIGKITIYSNIELNTKERFVLNLTSSEQKWLTQNKTIKIASLTSWPKDTEGQNIHTQYLDLLRKYGNLNIYNVEFESWNEAYNKVINNEVVDAILYLSWSKERSGNYFNYLPAYSFVPVNLVVKKTNTSIKSLKDLEGKTVYTLKKSISNTIVKQSGLNINTISLQSEEALVEALASKQAKADGLLTFNYDENSFENNGLKVVKRIQNRYGDVHIGVSKKEKELFAILAKAHNNIPKNELERIQIFRDIQSNNRFINKLNSKEKAYLTKKNSITMCVDPDWEPYERIDKEGKHIGLAADFINLIEKKLEKQFELIPTNSWEESLEFAKNGQCEILSFLNQTPQRDKFLNFTSTLYSEADMIVAKDDVSYIDGLDALIGKTVGVVKGYRTDEYVKKHYPNIHIKYIKNYEEGIRLVSEGKLYAIVNSLLGTAHLIKKSNLIDIKIAGKTKLDNDYKIGIIKSEPLLTQIVSKAVASIKQNQKEKIVSNWLTVKFEQSTDYSLILKALLIMVVILIFVYYRHYTIRAVNKQLKKEMKEQLEQIVEKDRMIFEQNKLTAMGEMIENIAHQWRQPLSQINSAVLLIDDEVYDLKIKNELIQTKLSEIESMTRYMSKTIDDFKDYYSKDKEKHTFKISDTIVKAISIVDASFHYNSISIEYDLDKKLDFYGIENELLQVILVILNNAKDILVDREISKPHIEVILKKQNKKIFIQIRDNGGGIDLESPQKIFEPYFTTKHKSQGTGLGLYLAKRIIEESMGGYLGVENIKAGACFTIKLENKMIVK